MTKDELIAKWGQHQASQYFTEYYWPLIVEFVAEWILDVGQRGDGSTETRWIEQRWREEMGGS